MKINQQHFILSILFFLILPLFPLLIDGIYNNGIVRERSLTLAASIFTITKGVSSKEPLVFGLNLIIGIFLVAIYGTIPKDAMVEFRPSLDFFTIKPQTLIIISVIIAQSCERYTIHILNNQPFFEFNKEDK